MYSRNYLIFKRFFVTILFLDFVILLGTFCAIYYPIPDVIHNIVHFSRRGEDLDVIVKSYYKSKRMIKNVLIWTPPRGYFISNSTQKNLTSQEFIKNNCPFNNCYLTYNRSYLKSEGEFDAIIFSASALNSYLDDLPKTRASRQKYIITTVDLHKIDARSEFKNYFNWTWTYRLNSDILWRYITIYNHKGKIIGPQINMKWKETLKDTSDYVLGKLKNKTEAVALIQTTCNATLNQYIISLEKELAKYNLTVDIFCDDENSTHKDAKQEFKRAIRKQYYFYLAFENGFDEDFVTDKILTAVQNLAVPIVRGGANYSRFLPPKSYLDSRQLDPKDMAETINNLIYNFTQYQEYFKWTNHYFYKYALDNEICNLCQALNDKLNFRKKTTYKDLKQINLQK